MVRRGLLATVETAAAAEEPDGRRRRSQDSRARIVAAMLELIHGGEITPVAEQVAERAKVGLRTVFRHFDDMDSLYGEMSHVIEAEVLEVVHRPFKGTTWQARVLELVERRGQAFERIAPYKRASDANRHRSRFLAERHAELTTVSREILRQQIPAQLARELFEAIDLLLSYEAWSRLRNEQSLTPRRAREVLEGAVSRLLEG